MNKYTKPRAKFEISAKTHTCPDCGSVTVKIADVSSGMSKFECGHCTWWGFITRTVLKAQ